MLPFFSLINTVVGFIISHLVDIGNVRHGSTLIKCGCHYQNRPNQPRLFKQNDGEGSANPAKPTQSPI